MMALLKDPPVEVSTGLFMLGTNEYPLFLARGAAGHAIFEGGTGTSGPLAIEQMRSLGIDGGSVKQLVITHAHPDHVMAVAALKEAFPGMVVLGSEAAAKTLSSEKAMAFFGKIDGALTGSLIDAGLVAEKHRPAASADAAIAVDRVIKQGDAVAVGADATFTVIETPGHSDCSLSFHDEANDVLIISDATGYYMPEHEYWWPNYFTGYEAYVKSMESLAALGARALCLSHNGVVTGEGDVAAYFGGAIDATGAYHSRIVEKAKAGKSGRDIAGELGAEVHEKTQLLPLEFFQKNCSLLVKQSLRHEGIAAE
ncbi:MAG: MBL fold metallo-hydrolase [Planctomycetota bacterium]|jgi:glyoxylase-like metal-dependent hydrolase (beta-lactamase superfamily II)